MIRQNSPSHKTVHDGCSPSQYIDPPGSLWSLENSAFWRSRPRVLKERSRTIANTTISDGSCMTDGDEGTPSRSSATPVPSISPEQSGIIRFGGFPTMKRSAPSPSSGSSRKVQGLDAVLVFPRIPRPHNATRPCTERYRALQIHETVQCTQNGTSQIHSRQVTANTTVETAVVEAPSLT